MLDVQLETLGVTEEMLDDPAPEMASALAPLIATRWVLDHPENPNSLAKLLDGTAADIQLIDATENLLPSKLKSVDVMVSATALCSGEIGRVEKVTVVAENNGWTISAFTIADGILASVGLGQALRGAGAAGEAAETLADSARLASLTLKQREAIETGTETVMTIIRDGLLNFTGILAPGAGDIITLGATTFGPITLPDATWFTVESGDSRLVVTVDEYKNNGDDNTTA